MSISQRSETDLSPQRRLMALVFCVLVVVLIFLVADSIALKSSLALLVTGAAGRALKLWPALMCKTIIFSSQMALGAWKFFDSIQKGSALSAVEGVLYFACWTWALTSQDKK